LESGDLDGFAELLNQQWARKKRRSGAMSNERIDAWYRLAMDNGATSGPIPGGSLTTEPAFGLPAYWITESERAHAEALNYTVVEASAVAGP